jgi:hypothetical protein
MTIFNKTKIKRLINDIQYLDNNQQTEIFAIIKQFSIKYSHNKNGVFIDMNQFINNLSQDAYADTIDKTLDAIDTLHECDDKMRDAVKIINNRNNNDNDTYNITTYNDILNIIYNYVNYINNLQPDMDISMDISFNKPAIEVANTVADNISEWNNIRNKSYYSYIAGYHDSIHNMNVKDTIISFINIVKKYNRMIQYNYDESLFLPDLLNKI